MQLSAHALPQPDPQQTLQTPKKNSVVITKRHEEMLQAIHTHRYVTAADMTHLFFAKTSINHVREMLSLLAGKGDYVEGQYLFRFPLPDTRIGNTEKIYTLGSKGRWYLRQLGMSIDWYFRPHKVAGMTYQNCLHALTLTRFLVAASVFCKHPPGGKESWQLPKMKTEYEIKKEVGKELATVTLTGGKTEETVSVIPDTWLDFHNPQRKKLRWVPILLEIDRASEQQQFFKKQMRARLLFLSANGGYQKLFGTNKGIFAYATTGNSTRLQSMRTWTKEVLAELDGKKYADRFRFCSLSPSWEQDEKALFLSPLWYRPLENNPVPLLS